MTHECGWCRDGQCPKYLQAGGRIGGSMIARLVLVVFTLNVTLLLSSCSEDAFWCRKKGNRECNTNEEKCVRANDPSWGGPFECMKTDHAYCFQSKGKHFDGSREDQIVCLAHKEDCEDWRNQRSTGHEVGPCIKMMPKEYPKDQSREK